MRIRQIVFAAHDLAAGRGALASLLGLGTPFRDPGVAEFGIDNAVFAFGDQFIEVISPMQAGSACGRHLARHGDSGYMLILQTDDLARERERFTNLGVRSIWSAAFDDISAMHLHPKDVGGAIVSVDEARPAVSWRWGGPNVQQQAGARSGGRVCGIALRAREPLALAQRWAQVLGRPEPARHGPGWRVMLTDGFADFRPSTNGIDGVAGFTLEAPNPEVTLGRARAAGLQVAGPIVTLLGCELTIEQLFSAGPAPAQIAGKRFLTASSPIRR